MLFHKTSQRTYGLMTVVSNIQKKKSETRKPSVTYSCATQLVGGQEKI